MALRSARSPLLLGRNRPALTGLRAVAVILVLLHHFDIRFLPQVGDQSGMFFPGAFVGVDVFFVLSGFLITTLLIERFESTGGLRLGRFWRDRVYRLLPALLAMTIPVAVGLTLIGFATLPKAMYSIVVVLIYGTNWAAVIGQDVLPPLGHTWSLAVEGQFYLIWPLLVLFFLRKGIRPRTAMIVLTIAILAVMVWRALLWQQSGVYFEVFPRTDARADTLLLGALASVAWRNGYVNAKYVRLLSVPALAALVVISFTIDLRDDAMYQWGYAVSALASAVLVLALLDADWWLGKALSLRTAVYLGNISYSLYLWHVPVLFAVGYVLADNPAIGAVAAAIGSLIAAAISWRWVEKPALSLKVRRQAGPLLKSDSNTASIGISR
jgi:peptidoglycan/LPS O-acetylase OafA/YrhL